MRMRLERIAAAERDRRAGLAEVAIAAIGEPTEWPARVVQALASLPESEGGQARSILESGLDQWASDLGFPPLDALCDVEQAAERVAHEQPMRAEELERPIEIDELERAFAEAEAQTDEMHDVNAVAERVLMDEPIGLAELSGQVLGLLAEEGVARQEREEVPVDAAVVEDAARPMAPDGGDAEEAGQRVSASLLATLERWLENLERRRAGRAQ